MTNTITHIMYVLYIQQQVLGASLSKPHTGRQSVYVTCITCVDCEKDKIRLTSHSSFVYVASVACTTENGNLTIFNMLITHDVLKMVSIVCREVGEVREYRLRRRRERDRLRRERN